MSSRSPYLSEFVQPYALCDLCKSIYESSVFIQTSVAYGSYESKDALHRRYNSIRYGREKWAFHSFPALQECCERGCHLCLMLWLDAGRQKITQSDQEWEKPLELFTSYSGRDLAIKIELKIETGPKEIRVVDLTSFLTNPQERYPDPSFSIQLCRRTTAEKLAEIVKFWLIQCTNHHTFCHSNHNTISISKAQPTRLLDVLDLTRPRLDVGDRPGTHEVEYLTLSHCRGAGNIFKLQIGNIEHLKREIPFDQLPRTFRDAMAITKVLGYRYLWIDSLCIIQDSEKDWAQEAGRMAQVYGNAIVNLAACGPSSDTGCFETRNPLGYIPCRISSHECSLYVGPNLIPFPNHLPLFTRGWIFQERLLSRRNIYFGMGELHWGCFEGIAVETWPRGMCMPDGEEAIGRTLYSVEDKVMFGHLLEATRQLKNSQAYEGQAAFAGFAEMWDTLISRHSKTKLTFLTDKLASISGIASAIVQRTSLEYVAGMWMSSLPTNLLWLRSTLNGSPMARPSWRGAPSWSWVSIDGGIWARTNPDILKQRLKYNSSSLVDTGRFNAEVLGCQVKQVKGRPVVLGEIAEAKLHINGILRPIGEWVVNDAARRGKCGPGTCTAAHAVFSELEAPVDFFPDVEIGKDASLFFLTVFRDTLKGWLKEEGLVLTPHLDGFVRVGYMSIRHPDDEQEQLLTADLCWGGGRTGAIFIY